MIDLLDSEHETMRESSVRELAELGVREAVSRLWAAPSPTTRQRRLAKLDCGRRNLGALTALGWRQEVLAAVAGVATVG